MSLTLVQRRGDREGQRFEREEFLAKILETSKGYSQRKHIALIGEPGAGKTTLLQTIAFRILDNHLGLPIWISLADLKKSDNKFQQLDDYLESRWLKQADTKMRLTSAMKVEFWKQWEKEKVWLFLDGVDEVATDNYSDLQNFFDWLPGSTANARVILTCRLNVWEAHINNWKFHEDWLDFDRWKFYQNWFNCDAYQLLDLIYPQQVKQFIDNGFNQPNLLAAPNANSLWEELQSHKDKWLNNLVKNPLRLALLCGSWQGEELSFPKTKAGLYKRFLEAFYTCKQKFFLAEETQLEKLNTVLESLAKKRVNSEGAKFRLQPQSMRKESGDEEQEGLFLESSDNLPKNPNLSAIQNETWLWEELQKPQDKQSKNLVQLARLLSGWQGTEVSLSETPAQLYEPLMTALSAWQEKHISTQEKQQKQLNTALGRLAKRAMNSEDSWFLLRYQLVREELGDETEKGSLFWWALQLGLLKPIVLEAKSSAEKIYAFFHPTFQEYFAALAVDDWHEFLTRVSEDPRQGIYRVFEPQWREVILLWLGREDVERLQKEALIQALIEFDDGCEIFKNKDVHKGFYEYQAYFLAAAGIAEFQESERAEEIASEFARYSCQTEWWIRDRASVTLLQTNYDLVGRILTDLLATTEDAYTRRNIAESLGKIDPGNREAIAALAHLVAITEDENTCFCAAENLAKIDPLNPKVIPVLFKLASPKVSDSTFFLYLDFSLILLEKPLLTGQMPFVVSEWKSYLTEHFYEADKFVYGQLFDTIWNCAQTLSYLEFYRAWHHLDNN